VGKGVNTEEKLPVGLIVVRVINILGAILSLVVGILMAMIAVPNFIKAAQDAGKIANPVLLIAVGLISVLLGSIPGILLLFQNRYLKSRKRSARIWQIVIGCIAIFAFPIGTILGIIILYFMLIDKGAKEFFI
jgi:NAD/NADP transhydrogenase alpha subunit